MQPPSAPIEGWGIGLKSDPASARSWSLQKRLRNRLLGAFAGFWLAGCAVALYGLWHETDEVLDSALEATARRLLALPDAALGDGRSGQLFGGMDEEFVVYQVFDGQGRLQLRSDTAPMQALDLDAANGVRNAGDWRVLTMTRGDHRRRVQVAESVVHRHGVLWASVTWLIVALGAFLPMAAWTLHTVLHRSFRALEPARSELAAREAHDLQPVSAVDLPNELQPWIATINDLIARVGNLVQAERTFAAQTAHELRTPLAAARAQAQRLAATAADDEVRSHAQALMRQLDRLTRLATRLLQLARIEAGIDLKREPVDLVTLARLVAGEFPDPVAGGRLRVEVKGEVAPIRGDLDAIGIAFRNLIDNALKHSGANSRVTIEVTPGQVSVADDGPGVPNEGLGNLVRPFERGQAFIEGTGLGLAIVDRIAQQSDALLRLRSPVEDGRGFCATLVFRK